VRGSVPRLPVAVQKAEGKVAERLGGRFGLEVGAVPLHRVAQPLIQIVPRPPAQERTRALGAEPLLEDFARLRRSASDVGFDVSPGDVNEPLHHVQDRDRLLAAKIESLAVDLVSVQLLRQHEVSGHRV